VPRAGVVIVVLTAVLAGCGGNDSTTTATTETSPPDPGKEVVGALVGAARTGDAQTMWGVLSKASRRRYGPTLADFRQGEARALRRTLAPFARGPLPVQVSENIDGTIGVVALSRGANAWATPLRLEDGFWRVELPGRLHIDVSGPPPGSKGKFADQVGVEVRGRSGAGTALLYLDGETLQPEIYSGGSAATVFASLPNGAGPGRHTVVAFATSGDEAAARAWTFLP
jgi:hypothetical protein